MNTRPTQRQWSHRLRTAVATMCVFCAGLSGIQATWTPRSDADGTTVHAAEAHRPNLLFLIADQHRGDFLHCAGHPLVQTPSLDRLAAQGVRFERAYTSWPIFCYTADHGDMQWQFERFGKGVMFDGATRIPLILRAPGRVPAGVVRSEVVEHVDLYPTFCDLLGTPLPPTVQGRSLLPLLQGRGSPALNAGVVIHDNGGRDYWGQPVAESAPPHVGAYNDKWIP